MDLLERTQVVVDLLTGSDREDLARKRGLDPDEIEIWLKVFLEGGIAALQRAELLDGRGDERKIIPLFGEREESHAQTDEGHAERG